MCEPVLFLTWGIIVSFDRKSCRPISAIFCPSIITLPPDASIMRKRAKVKDDLPAPVRPTIPT